MKQKSFFSVSILSQIDESLNFKLESNHFIKAFKLILLYVFLPVTVHLGH